MDIEELKKSNSIIFECVSGSRAYGLSTENSDWDIKGVYILPRDIFYSFYYQDQISDEKNNVVYYELRKFLELLGKNNPNMLEMLNVPEECILYQHPLYCRIIAKDFLSKLCKETFARYALSQLKKAWGLNKKILNPIDKKLKTVLDYCYIIEGQNSVSLMEFLKKTGLSQVDLGLVSIPHIKDVYAVYQNLQGLYKGVMQNDRSMEVSLSSVMKGEKPIGNLYFNKDGYSTYYKDYREYWDWVENRNDVRFQNTVTHGKNYDAKNMMHVFRLLNMAEDIGRLGQISVRQMDRDFLLKIKNGDFYYEELVEKANKKMLEIEEIYKTSSLPEKPNLSTINQLLVDMRKDFYTEVGLNFGFLALRKPRD